MKINEKRYDSKRRCIAMQRGFSLVELLVALVIGLIIILGAGQLFLTGFLNFRQVQLLGDKQSALTFASETLVRDIRRAKTDCTSAPDCISFNGGELTLFVANRDDVAGCDPGDEVTKTYWVREADGENVMQVRMDCDGLSSPINEPITGGFSTSGFSAQPGAVDGVWLLTFDLLSNARNPADSESIVFRVVNRTTAMQSFGS